MPKAAASIVLAATAILIFSGIVSAAAAPVCPDTNSRVCIFSGVTLQAVKPTVSSKPVPTSSFQCPVSGSISGTLNGQYTNLNGETRKRQGIQIEVPLGTPVKSPARVTVADTGTDLLRFGGQFVTLRHADNPGIEITIAQLQTVNVRGGDKTSDGKPPIIQPGEVIGTSGADPATQKPGVYFELRRGGLVQREVEDICKGSPSALGKVDCREFTLNPVPDSWNVEPGGRFGSPRSYPGGHSGFDYGGFYCGTPVKAVWAGQMQYYKATGAGYGNEVSIKTACTDGTERIVTYDHLQGFNTVVLSKGYVQAGEVIAYLGNTGGDYRCHLHVNVFGAPFRIQNGLSAGNVINPETLVKGGLQGHLA